MKTPLFLANIVSAILLINLTLTQPSITGFAVSPTTPSIKLISPLGLSSIIIITTLILDIYFYMKSKKEK